MTTVLLGPQRFRMTAGTVARGIAPEGTVATVTAGWRDREKDDAELDQVLSGRSRNLHLFTRLGHVVRHDRTFASAASAYNRAVDEASELYTLRLQHALDAVYAISRRSVRDDLVDSSLRAGLQSVRDIDAWFLWVLAELEGELRADGGVDTSDVITQHRAEVAEILADASLLAIAGGHVAYLSRCLRLFAVEPPGHLPVIGWSAGAMVLTDLIVLYNDKGSEGVRPSEVWDRGLGRVHGVVAMPHARRRLQLDDKDRNTVLAHRYAPARVVLLDDGGKVVIGDDGELPPDARVITAEGRVATVDEDARLPTNGGSHARGGSS
ncbi:MAG: Type 1 glutamine amidotransferase-like domain-containing protein [Dermatophilaceae bacterium]